MYITPEFMERLLLLIVLGGFVGAIGWDLLKAALTGVISAISFILGRNERIELARMRAAIRAEQKEVQQ